MDEKLVERAEAAITLGGKTGSRGKSPSNIYNVAADLLEALALAQARIRELETALADAQAAEAYQRGKVAAAARIIERFRNERETAARRALKEASE